MSVSVLFFWCVHCRVHRLSSSFFFFIQSSLLTAQSSLAPFSGISPCWCLFSVFQFRDQKPNLALYKYDVCHMFVHFDTAIFDWSIATLWWCRSCCWWAHLKLQGLIFLCWDLNPPKLRELLTSPSAKLAVQSYSYVGNGSSACGLHMMRAFLIKPPSMAI